MKNKKMRKIEKITVTWEVDDGYDGRSRPQTTIVDEEDLEDCETKEEIREVIDECVRAEMNEMGYSITNADTEYEEE